MIEYDRRIAIVGRKPRLPENLVVYEDRLRQLPHPRRDRLPAHELVGGAELQAIDAVGAIEHLRIFRPEGLFDFLRRPQVGQTFLRIHLRLVL